MKSVPQQPKPAARILLVDDHAIVRYGIGVLLSAAKDLTICGEADTYNEALTAIKNLKPDIIVLDLILHERSGLDLIQEIRKREQKKAKVGCQKCPILVLSMHNESTHGEKAIRAGAQGYIMKEDADEILVEAIRTVLGGNQFISDTTRKKLLNPPVAEQTTGVKTLTAREKEIFEAIGKGISTREMAKQFELSPRTVDVHRANIKKKLNCETGTKLIRTAVQWMENR